MEFVTAAQNRMEFVPLLSASCWLQIRAWEVNGDLQQMPPRKNVVLFRSLYEPHINSQAVKALSLVLSPALLILISFSHASVVTLQSLGFLQRRRPALAQFTTTPAPPPASSARTGAAQPPFATAGLAAAGPPTRPPAGTWPKTRVARLLSAPGPGIAGPGVVVPGVAGPVVAVPGVAGPGFAAVPLPPHKGEAHPRSSLHRRPLMGSESAPAPPNRSPWSSHSYWS